MPKFSIYIPDDLWTAAQAVSPNVKPSPLVQVALKRLVDARSLSARAKLPDSVIAHRHRVIEGAVAAAASRYVDGYRIGLNVIQSLPWGAIEDFDRVDLDIDRWDAELENHGEEFDDLWSTRSADFLESSITQNERPTGILRDGFVDAFRDVLAAAKAFPHEGSDSPPRAASTEPASTSPTSKKESD